MADLIRRSDVIGLLEDMLLFGEYDIIASSFSEADEEKAYRAINDIPAVNRRIPCSERLPEVGQRVLALYDYETCGVSSRYWMLASLAQDGYWTEGCTWHPHESITHWMPLPELPEKE